MNKGGFFGDFLKSEYEKQNKDSNVLSNEKLKPISTDVEKIRNFMKRESHEQIVDGNYNYTLIVVSSILVAVGFIPFVGLFACFTCLFLLNITKSVQETKLADYIGVMLFSTSIVVSISSTIYYLFFNLIFNN